MEKEIDRKLQIQFKNILEEEKIDITKLTFFAIVF